MTSKSTTVKLVKSESGEEENLARLQMRMLSDGDKLLVHFPRPSNPLCFAYHEDYEFEYRVGPYAEVPKEDSEQSEVKVPKKLLEQMEKL